jgi:hypothetical protein
MTEKNINETGPAQESLENQKYKEFQTAQDEEASIMEEINKVFATTPNREDAEKIVLETLAPKMDEAIKKSKQALDSWLAKIKR